ncbi:MAG: NAD(P)H-dependent glycerol-3-phosphate dehydrogenase [Eggerthellaceae bacterium]|nr:NAD(P)H-dependent glycerol-3-phosphate dehydrogenase [Eggerthellaceae bacterium]
MKVAVIGAGSWGTALSQVLAGNGHDVALWARKLEVVRGINEQHHNPRYLIDAQLSPRLRATLSYAEALDGADAVVVVTPSHLVRGVARELAKPAYALGGDVPILICSKGVEEETGALPIETMAEEAGGARRIAVLSGPNHAEEVIKGQPSATVIASSSEETAVFFRDLFATDTFRTYTSDDPVGVELCAAFKNVIAIAVGISYGLGFGDNTASLLITRGLAEMSRMVVAAGGQALTCMGLAGAGDMVVTCMSKHSRNRRFGEQYVARGRTVDDFAAETHMVVEGALACKTLEVLARRYGVELPITDTVRDIVWNGADVKTAAKLLSDRPLTTEFYGR